MLSHGKIMDLARWGARLRSIWAHSETNFGNAKFLGGAGMQGF
jgi:hypothetical protein